MIGQAYPELTDIHVRAGCQGGNMSIDAAIRMAAAILTVAKKIRHNAPRFVFVLRKRDNGREYLRPKAMLTQEGPYVTLDDERHRADEFEVLIRPYPLAAESFNLDDLTYDLDNKWRNDVLQIISEYASAPNCVAMIKERLTGGQLKKYLAQRR